MCNNERHARRVMVIDFSGEFTTKEQMNTINTFGEIHLITNGVAFLNKLRTIFCRSVCLNKCPLNIIVDEKEKLNNDVTIIDYLVLMGIEAEIFNFSFKKINKEEIYKNNIKDNKQLEYLVNSKKELRQIVEFKNKMKELDRQEQAKKTMELKRKTSISKLQESAIDNMVRNIMEVKNNRPIRKRLFSQFKQKHSSLTFSQYRTIIKRVSL